MCGIAGIIGCAAQSRDLQTMLQAIAHRGEPAYRQETAWGLDFVVGANRLAIVDALHGKQPFRSDDGAVYCVSNGEIYNHAILRKILARRRELYTHCDTEVILHGWEEWGTNLASHLQGMFAFGIVDLKRNLWALARDPLGIKPLFYARRESSIFFASEAKALTALGRFEKILTLRPGTLMMPKGLVAYSCIGPFGPSDERPEPTLSDVRHSLEAAVQSHLPPPGEPAAVLLSGGVDSSTVLLLVKKLHKGPITAFTIAANGKSSEDLEASTSLCRYLNVPLHVVTPKVRDLTDFYLSRGVYMTETFEPALVRNATIYYFLCREVRAQGYKFCLSGEGADEVFGGYRYFKRALQQDRDLLIRRSLLEIHQTYLQMADRASMHATLEVRVPYMDYRFVGTAIRLSSEMRIRHGMDKWALRHLYETDLPEANRLRCKTGMNAGAGFGSNDPDEGIYAEAVAEQYSDGRKYDADVNTVRPYCKTYQLDMTDPEEVYNFARYVEFGFTAIKLSPIRPQLNTSALRSTSSIA
jgi:asparagine synthase (glutamine-hydrolysing)